MVSLPGLSSGKGCSCFDFPLLLQVTSFPQCPTVVRTCWHCHTEVPAPKGDDVLALFGLAGGSDAKPVSK